MNPILSGPVRQSHPRRRRVAKVVTLAMALMVLAGIGLVRTSSSFAQTCDAFPPPQNPECQVASTIPLGIDNDTDQPLEVHVVGANLTGGRTSPVLVPARSFLEVGTARRLFMISVRFISPMGGVRGETNINIPADANMRSLSVAIIHDAVDDSYDVYELWNAF